MLAHNNPDLSELSHLTLIWAAKEAAKKALSTKRMPGFLELLLADVEPHMSGWIFNVLISSRNFRGYPTTATTAADLYDGFAIAACLTESPNSA